MAAKLNTTQIQKHLKVLGKLIYISQQGPTQATTFRTAISSTIDQLSTGNASDVVALVKIGNPLVTTLNTLAGNLDSVPATAKSWVSAYLQQVVALDMGLAAGSSVSTVGGQLASDMADGSNNQTVAPSGGGNSTGYRAYLADNFNVLLPQAANAGAATCPDSWITVTPQ